MQFGRVAMLYYPDCNCRVTVRHFCKEIAQARGLLQALQYTWVTATTSATYPPCQMRLIEQYLVEV